VSGGALLIRWEESDKITPVNVKSLTPYMIVRLLHRDWASIECFRDEVFCPVTHNGDV